MEEKEAKEDQGDDRHQVVRIGAESCFILHGVHPYRCRKLFGPLRGSSEWVQEVVSSFMGLGGMGAEIAAWFHGMRAVARRDP